MNALVPTWTWLAAAVVALGPAAFVLALPGDDRLAPGSERGLIGRYRTWVGGELKALGWPMTIGAFALQHALITFGLLALGLVMTTEAKTAMLTLAGLLSPFLWFNRMHAQRQKLLNEQLDPGLQLMANAVRATQNLLDGFDTLARNGVPPLATEAELLVREVHVGASIEEAMHNLARRCKNRNIDSVVTALSIGRRTGGNLPKVLELIAHVLRETMRVEGLIASKTAEGKASGYVMAALPVVFMLAMQTFDPDWMQPLYDDIVGNFILAAVVLLDLAGALLIRKVSTIDV